MATLSAAMGAISASAATGTTNTGGGATGGKSAESHEFLEVNSVSLEWKLSNLKHLFDTSKGETKSKCVKSAFFGAGKWQVFFYPNSGHDQYCSLYLSCHPTQEECERGALNAASGPTASGSATKPSDPTAVPWSREGLFKFTFEIKSLDRRVVFKAMEAHDHAFSHEARNWGWAQYWRRNDAYYSNHAAKYNDAFLICCTIVYSCGISFLNFHERPLIPTAETGLPPFTSASLTRRTVPNDLLDAYASLFNDPDNSDVCFRIIKPSTSKHKPRRERTLYASKKILGRRSDYFQAMFESGFAEGTLESPSVSVGLGFGKTNSHRDGTPETYWTGGNEGGSRRVSRSMAVQGTVTRTYGSDSDSDSDSMMREDDDDDDESEDGSLFDGDSDMRDRESDTGGVEVLGPAGGGAETDEDRHVLSSDLGASKSTPPVPENQSDLTTPITANALTARLSSQGQMGAGRRTPDDDVRMVGVQDEDLDMWDGGNAPLATPQSRTDRKKGKNGGGGVGGGSGFGFGKRAVLEVMGKEGEEREAKKRGNGGGGVTHRRDRRRAEVVVTDASYQTFKALLYFLYTDAITFAPLASTYLCARDAAAAASTSFPYPTRKSYVEATMARVPAVPGQPVGPGPCNAKAIYRLADKIGLPELKARAFDHIVRSLTAQNIPMEVFSDFTSSYEEVKKCEIDFMLAKWNEVRDGPAMRLVLDSLRTDGRRRSRSSFPGFSSVWSLLLSNLEYRPQKTGEVEAGGAGADGVVGRNEVVAS